MWGIAPLPASLCHLAAWLFPVVYYDDAKVRGPFPPGEEKVGCQQLHLPNPWTTHRPVEGLQQHLAMVFSLPLILAVAEDPFSVTMRSK